MYNTEGFFDYLLYERRYSQHTIIAYKGDLKQFFEYLETTGNEGIKAVKPKTIRNWIVYLHNLGIGPRSIHRKVSSVKKFFKYVFREGLVDANPAQHVNLPKIPKRLPVFVREKEMGQLLDHVDFGNNYEGVRNKLIIELFYGTGMRLSEMVELKNFDLDLKRKLVKVLGKRNKERLIPLTNELLIIIPKFITLKNELFGSDYTPWFLLTNKGEKIYHKLIYRIVTSYLPLVTSMEKKSPHVLRHTFATVLLNRGADLYAIKELLGHSNLNATEVYTHNSFEKLNAIYKQAHPRA